MIMEPAPPDPAASSTIATQVDSAQGWASGVTEYSMRLLAQYGFRALGAIVVLIAAYFLAGWARRVVLAALTRAHLDPTISKFASNMTRYAVIVLGLMSCAPIMGINITAFAAVLGAGGLAVGLASQGALSNGAAGLMLLITRPFKAGDTIVVDGISGIVEEIELFATTLNTPDNRRIFMPNNSIFGKVIENSTLNPRRSTTFFTVVSSDCDVEKVRSTLRGACLSCASALKEPAPDVLLADLTGGGLKWQITVWAETKLLNRARDEAITAVRDALAHEGIGAPVQVTTVRLLDHPGDRPGQQIRDDLRTSPAAGLRGGKDAAASPGPTVRA
jgi:small conductance mechanosensitive channel